MQEGVRRDGGEKNYKSAQARFGMAMPRVVTGSEAVLGAASNMWPVFSMVLQVAR